MAMLKAALGFIAGRQKYTGAIMINDDKETHMSFHVSRKELAELLEMAAEGNINIRMVIKEAYRNITEKEKQKLKPVPEHEQNRKTRWR